jgi:hypothetical protein
MGHRQRIASFQNWLFHTRSRPYGASSESPEESAPIADPRAGLEFGSLMTVSLLESKLALDQS